MRYFRKRLAVIIIFGVTLVSVLAGVGYARWTDSVKMNVTAGTWDYYVNNTLKDYDPVSGFIWATPNVIDTDMTVSIDWFAFSFYDEHITIMYNFKNQSTVPIEIDDITINPVGYISGNDQKDIDIQIRAAEAYDFSNQNYSLNRTRTYKQWAKNNSNSNNIKNFDVGIDDEIYIRVDVYDTSSVTWTMRNVTLQLAMEYSVYE